MYARDVDGKRLSFRAPSTQWKNDMAMQDLETKTYWSHHSLKALDGPLKGKSLQIVAHVETTWAEWKRSYPNSHFVEKSDTWVKGNVDLWKPYTDDPDVTGQIGVGTKDPRLPGKTLCVGLWRGKESVCYVLSEVDKGPRQPYFANEMLDGIPIVLVADPTRRTVASYVSTVAGRKLKFSRMTRAADGRTVLVDKGTGSTWDVLSGRAIAGRLRGARLAPFPHLAGYWFSWCEHYPGSRLGKNEVYARP